MALSWTAQPVQPGPVHQSADPDRECRDALGGEQLMAPRRSSRETGVALIEFAFILPFLFVLTFVVIDLSRAFYLKSMITAAAREGARVAAVTPDPSGVGRDSVVARVGKVLQPTG